MRCLVRARQPLLNSNLAMFATGGRDPSSLSTKQFFEAELKENPEFFRAFPHLQRVLSKDGNEAVVNEENMPN